MYDTTWILNPLREKKKREREERKKKVGVGSERHNIYHGGEES
jgi:hypothetical protein